jgi:hypothetical protein
MSTVSLSSTNKLNRINTNLKQKSSYSLYCFHNFVCSRKATKMINKYLVGNTEYVKIALTNKPELLFYQYYYKNILHYAINKFDTEFILYLLHFAQNTLSSTLYNKWLRIEYPPFMFNYEFFNFSYYSYPIKMYNFDIISLLLKNIPLNQYIILDLVSIDQAHFDYKKTLSLLKNIFRLVNFPKKINLHIHSTVFSMLLKPSNPCNIYDYNLSELLDLLSKNKLDFNKGAPFYISYHLGWLEYILHEINPEKIKSVYDNYNIYLLKNLTKIYYLYFLPMIKSKFLMKYLQIEFKLLQLKEQIFSYYTTNSIFNIKRGWKRTPLGILTYYYLRIIPFLEYLKFRQLPKIFLEEFIIFNVLEFL